MIEFSIFSNFEHVKGHCLADCKFFINFSSSAYFFLHNINCWLNISIITMKWRKKVEPKNTNKLVGNEARLECFDDD